MTADRGMILDAPVANRGIMPTITVTVKALVALGVSRTELTPVLTLEAKRVLQPLLARSGFDIRGRILAIESATVEGHSYILSQ